MNSPAKHVEATVDVVPFYGQIEVGDRDLADKPQWVTGEESVISNDSMVCVATQSDTEGSVQIAILSEPQGDLSDRGHEVFFGELSLPSGHLVVGSSIGAQMEEFDLTPARSVNVRILVHPQEAPRNVTVLLSHVGKPAAAE
jgi:hypothetical protein